MHKVVIVSLTITLAAFAVAAPIWLAVHESAEQSYAVETSRALAYARDVIHRSDRTADQASEGIAKLTAPSAGAPCSETNLAVMREIDMVSSYIQAMVHLEGTRIVCSSLGRDLAGIDLGPIDFTSSRGTALRAQVRLPFAPDAEFVSLEQKGFAAFIHKNLPIDITTSESGVSLAIFATGRMTPLTRRGFVDPAWPRAGGDRVEHAFVDGDYVVARVRSTKYLSVAVAAVPVSYLEQRTRQTILKLVPLGLFSGIVLTAAILWLARFQMAIPSAIRAGLRKNEFYLVYQPIVRLDTGACIGVEALLRWRRPTGEHIGPDLFIPVAEESELITRLTRRVLELVARDAAGIFASHPDFHIAVNLSAADFRSTRFGPELDAMLASLGARPHNIVLELTERRFLNADEARLMTRHLRQKGLEIAIDDFGTGYSSLSYLESLELDYLKIDRSFIEAIGRDGPASQVVPYIIDMAKGLQLEMIAEGVESQAQADYLRERGVRYAQGWHFGRPVPFAQVRALLEKGQ